MPKGMQAIYKQTASGSANTISFFNIPQTYTDLVLYISSRSGAATQSAILITLNSNNTSVYSSTRLLGTGSGVSTDRFSSQSYGSVYNNAQAHSSITSGIHGSSFYYFPNYSKSFNKSFFVDGVQENFATAAQLNFLGSTALLQSPISSISVSDANGANFSNQSTFTLYGIAGD